MVITESIRQAILSAIEQSGSSLSFARSVGVSHTTVSYWLKGRTRKINTTIWNNLRPLIEVYLGDAGRPSFTYPEYKPVRERALELREPRSQYHAGVPKPAVSKAPLFSFEDLAEFDPAFDSLENLSKEKPLSMANFTSVVAPGQFAVTVDEDHDGFFHPGTVVLLAWGEIPYENDVVLVKLREKDRFLFARYGRKGETVILTPLQEGSVRPVSLAKGKLRSVCAWIAPVRESVQIFG